MNRADRKRQEKADEKSLLHGIDTDTTDPATTAAMARQFHALLEKAKRSGDIDPPVAFLHAKVNETLKAVPIEVACARGCTHCCNGWVSVSAPEILYLAKRVRENGDDLIARLLAAHETTKAYSMAERPGHPHPCAMLKDGGCGLYDSRPSACRFASSLDAAACQRVLLLLAADTIPSPMRHVRARERYQIAIAAALARAGLPHRFYDLTAGLARVLSREDAEAAWLSGEDVLFGVNMDPTDVIGKPSVDLVMRHAFGEVRGQAPAR